jgi:biotin-dependent carboxylase-like uncharacterized protein
VIEIVELGWATTVQDAGRRGLGHLGVPRSGCVDPSLAALVNRLVGNDAEAAVIETAGGLVVEAASAVMVAGSDGLAPTTLRRGERYRLGADPRRTWSYLAVRGGIDVDPVLGSRSHDTLSGVGPAALAAGQLVPVGADPGRPIVVDVAPPPPDRPARLWPGPRLDWFATEVFDLLCATTWIVGAETNRVGVRLDGPRLVRRRADELPSEGLVLGAVQVPHDGRPVVMLPDHPTTGGYPVVAVVDTDDVGLVGQTRPGSVVRFVRAAR